MTRNEKEARKLVFSYGFLSTSFCVVQTAKKKTGKRGRETREAGSFRTRLYSASFNRPRVAGVSLPPDACTADEHFVPSNS